MGIIMKRFAYFAAVSVAVIAQAASAQSPAPDQSIVAAKAAEPAKAKADIAAKTATDKAAIENQRPRPKA